MGIHSSSHEAHLNALKDYSVCNQERLHVWPHLLIIAAVERPFRIDFKTDENEVTGGLVNAEVDEEKDAPGGIIGFSLNFLQQAC